MKIFVFLLLAAPLSAHAHLVTTGVGPFYDGAAHFFLSFEELLPVLALALLAGLRGARHGRWLIAILPLTWLVGAFFFKGFLTPLGVTAALVVPGALAAWDRNLPLWSVISIAALLAVAAGSVNGTAMSAQGVLGAASMAFVCATLAAALLVSLQGGWQRTAARVAASWLAAVGVLALGWTLKG